MISESNIENCLQFETRPGTQWSVKRGGTERGLKWLHTTLRQQRERVKVAKHNSQVAQREG